MTQQYASADDLVSNSVEDTARDVTLPSGRTVRIRGLSRYELLLSGKNTDDSAVIERRNVAVCMVEPKMTEAQVEKWQKSSLPGELAAVTMAIRELSGLAEGAQKSNLQGAGE